MAFTAAAIVAPNVPDKCDPIKYLTTTPQTKAQEQAQIQAQALAYAKLHGMPPSELDRIVFGAEAPKPSMNEPLTREEQLRIQDEKVPYIPIHIRPLPDIGNTTVDYPYLFTNVRIRSPYQSIEISQAAPPERPPRESSCIGTRMAPTVELTPSEYEMGANYLEVIRKTLSEYGIVKIRLPRGHKPLMLPFGPEVTGFRTKKQTVVNGNTQFNYRQIKRGFFRALIRFHSTRDGKRRLQKLPLFERKPVDFFRLFHIVEARGGADSVTKRKEWAQVGRELGYSSYALPTLSSTVRQLHTRVVQPFKEWLTTQLPNELNNRLLPRLDVDDVGSSDWHHLDHGITIDLKSTHTSFSKRRVVDYEDIKHSPPCYTLKTFKQKHYEVEVQPHSASADQLEHEFATLPEWYECEYMFPRAKLIRYRRDAHADVKWDDPWDMTAFSTRYDRDFFPYMGEHDFDDILLSDIGACSKFTSEEWYVPPTGCYEVNLLADGKPRTWYTKSGVWVDQAVSEVVVVDPATEVMNWSHGYSVMSKSRVLLNSNWLVMANTADEKFATATSDVCVQQVVYNIATSGQAEGVLLSNVKSQALSVLDDLESKEISLFKSGVLKGLRREVVPIEVPPITCQLTQKRRFFSWIAVVGGDTYSLEAFLGLKAKPDLKNCTLVTKYASGPEEFFWNLRKQIEGASALQSKSWLKRANDTLTSPDLPAEADLKDLVNDAPSEHWSIAIKLQEAIKKLQQWMRSENPESDFRRFVECTNNDPKLIETWKHIEKETERVAREWEDLIGAINVESLLVDPGVLKEKLTVLQKNKPFYLDDTHHILMRDIQEVITWVEAVFRALHEIDKRLDNTLDTLGHLTTLRDEGLRMHGLAINSTPMALLIKERSFVSTAFAQDMTPPQQTPQPYQAMPARVPDRVPIMVPQPSPSLASQLEVFLRSDDALNPARIMELRARLVQPDGGAEAASVDKHLLTKFGRLCQSFPLIQRMYSQNVVDRPKRTEVTELVSIAAISNSLSELDNWLTRAKQLDWITIARRLHLLASNQPPSPHHSPPVSIAEIINVYSQLHYLKIVPDDIENVKATFENTLARIRLTPIETVLLYGFGA